MLEKSTVVKGLMSKEWEWSSITERSTELIPKLVGQNGISVSTMVISVKGSPCFQKCPWILVVHSFFQILSVTQSGQKVTSQPASPQPRETSSGCQSHRVLSEYDFSSARPLSLVTLSSHSVPSGLTRPGTPVRRPRSLLPRPCGGPCGPGRL